MTRILLLLVVAAVLPADIFGRFLAQEQRKWGAVVKAIGFKAE